jgi:acyl carrier protein
MTEELRKGYTRDGARDRLFDLIGTNARVLRADLSEEKKLKDDLNLDSFDFVSIVSAAEGEFGISIPDEEFNRFQTVGDVFDELWRRLDTCP